MKYISISVCIYQSSILRGHQLHHEEKDAFQFVLQSIKYTGNLFYYMQWKKNELWNQVEVSSNSGFVCYCLYNYVQVN